MLHVQSSKRPHVAIHSENQARHCTLGHVCHRLEMCLDLLVISPFWFVFNATVAACLDSETLALDVKFWVEPLQSATEKFPLLSAGSEQCGPEKSPCLAFENMASCRHLAHNLLVGLYTRYIYIYTCHMFRGLVYCYDPKLFQVHESVD